jgi:hypothetical protein
MRLIEEKILLKAEGKILKNTKDMGVHMGNHTVCYMMIHMGNHMQVRMENENGNENRIEIGNFF